jgi:hypothetical protein
MAERREESRGRLSLQPAQISNRLVRISTRLRATALCVLGTLSTAASVGGKEEALREGSARRSSFIVPAKKEAIQR